MDESRREPTVEDIDALLHFLPVFQEPGLVFATWDSEPGDFPTCNLGGPAGEFVEALYHHSWVFSFDWPSWQEEAERLTNTHGALATADLERLQRLLTTHVRKDRFCEGHLLGAFESGHLTAILERLAELREEVV